MKLKFRSWDNLNMIFFDLKGLENYDKDEYNINLDCVMQFTGLEDKKENEIYEGDILIEEFGDKDFVIFEIIWIDIYDAGYKEIKTGNPNCCYDVRLNRSYSRHTIIGNKYENPEMMKKSYWTKKRINDALVGTDVGGSE